MNHLLSVYKIIIILSIVSLILPSFGFIQAQNQTITAPETMEEAKEMGERVGEEIKEKMPGILERLWQERVLPVWQKMADFWEFNIWPKIVSWFKTEIEPRVKEEFEKRKPILEEEFQKEKQELKEELPKVSKSLWERFKELIK